MAVRSRARLRWAALTGVVALFALVIWSRWGKDDPVAASLPSPRIAPARLVWPAKVPASPAAQPPPPPASSAKTGTLAGRVLDSGAGVVASARVHATIYVLNAEGTHDRREFATTSDEEGRYRLTLPKGRNRIVASADGYAPTDVSLEIYGDQTKDLTLEPSAYISGRVVTGAERTPVAGAEVKLRRENGYDTTGRLLTDERGAFTSNALSPGTYRLEARKDGLLGRFAKAIVLSATDRIDGIEIVVSATFAVRGRVTAPSGSAIAVAVVNLETDESMGFGALPARVVTDDEGRYVIDGFLPREYQLQISARGYATRRETITLSSDLTRDVVLGPPARVRGVVLTSGGQPAAQAEIEGALIPLTGGKAIIARAASDARGHFTLGGLGPGALVVTARKNADVAVHAPIVLGPAGVDGVTLTLARGGRILGVITHTDDSTGPLTRLNLTTPLLNGAHFTMDTVVSAQRGTFDIVGIPLGLIRLRAGPLRGPIDENATEVTVTLTAEKPEMKVTLAAP